MTHYNDHIAGLSATWVDNSNVYHVRDDDTMKTYTYATSQPDRWSVMREIREQVAKMAASKERSGMIYEEIERAIKVVHELAEGLEAHEALAEAVDNIRIAEDYLILAAQSASNVEAETDYAYDLEEARSQD